MAILHWYASEQTPFWQLHPLVTVHPAGIGLQGSRVCAESSDAPDAIVIALNIPRRTFFTMNSVEISERTHTADSRKIRAYKLDGNPFPGQHGFTADKFGGYCCWCTHPSTSPGAHRAQDVAKPIQQVD